MIPLVICLASIKTDVAYAGIAYATAMSNTSSPHIGQQFFFETSQSGTHSIYQMLKTIYSINTHLEG